MGVRRRGAERIGKALRRLEARQSRRRRGVGGGWVEQQECIRLLAVMEKARDEAGESE